MPLRPAARLAGLSPRRRGLLAVIALVVVALAVGGVLLAGRGSSPPADPAASRPSYVLLVPGYGGSTTALSQLAARIRATGRTATVVPLAGDGTGDLQVQARVLNGYVVGIVLRSLSSSTVSAPRPGQCHALQALGSR